MESFVVLIKGFAGHIQIRKDLVDLIKFYFYFLFKQNPRDSRCIWRNYNS